MAEYTRDYMDQAVELLKKADTGDGRTAGDPQKTAGDNDWKRRGVC